MSDEMSKMANIKASLDEYVNDNLGYDGEELNIDFEGAGNFETTGKGTWIQPRIMYFSRQYLRQGSNTEYAHLNNIMFNINIFVVRSGATLASKHYMVRDQVADYFKIGQTIPLKNHTSGVSSPPVLEYMKVRKIITDAPLSTPTFRERQAEKDILQWTLTYEIDFTELTTEV